MPRLICVTCSSPDVLAIDAAILAGHPSIRSLAAQYHLDYSSVRRHRIKGHVNPIAEGVFDVAPAVLQAAGGLYRLRALNAELDERLAAAVDTGSMAYVGLQRERRLASEALIKAEGPQAPPPVALETTPEWLVLREAINDALVPWPEAKAACWAAVRKAL